MLLGGSARSMVVVRYTAAADVTVPDLAASGIECVARPQEEWHTTSVDTADHRLRARGIALHHWEQAGEGPGTWHLELPAVGDRPLRTPVLQWAGARSAVPEQAAALLSGVIGRSALRWSTVRHVVRQPYVLRGAPAVPLGVLSHDTVIPSHPADSEQAIREPEVTLRLDIGGVADGIVGVLAQAGAEGVPGASAAATSGTVMPLGTAPDQVPGRSARIGDVVRHALRAGLDQLLDRDLRLRMDPRAPAAADVHQARVAARRLRSELSTFHAVLDPVWLRHVRDDLRWLGTVLGQVRDIDILLQIAGDPGVPREVPRDGMRQQLLAQRLDASADLAAVLASRRYLDLLDRLRAAAAHPPYFGEISPTRQARRVLPKLVAARWHVLRKAVHNAGKRPSDTALHRVRIEAKALRYSAEVAAPVMGPRAARTAQDARALQTVLGAHHDAVAAEAWLREQCSSSNDAGSVFAAGWLAAAQRQRQAVLRRRWRAAWRPLARHKRHRWLR